VIRYRFAVLRQSIALKSREPEHRLARASGCRGSDRKRNMNLIANNQARLDAESAILRVVQVLAPILALIVTLAAWVKFGVMENGATMPVDSPLKATLGLGLAMFPGGTFFTAHGLVHWARRRQSRFWPVVKGHVIEPGPVQPFIVATMVSFWYVVDGRRYDKSIQVRSRPTETDVEVRFDPDNPEIAVLAAGDAAAQVNIWAGVTAFAAPFILAWPLVWLGS